MTRKTTPAPGEVGQNISANAQAMGSAMSEMWQSMAGLSLPMDAMSQLQSDYLAQAASMWNSALTSNRANRPPSLATSVSRPTLGLKTRLLRWQRRPTCSTPAP